MSKKSSKKDVHPGQLSLFDDFFSSLTINEGEVSFDELNRVIGELNKIKNRKKVEEEKRKREKEQEEALRKEPFMLETFLKSLVVKSTSTKFGQSANKLFKLLALRIFTLAYWRLLQPLK